MPQTQTKFLLPHFRPITASSPNLIYSSKNMAQFNVFYPFIRLFDMFTAILAFAFSFGLAVIVALILVFLVQRMLQAIRGTTPAEERNRREN